MGDVLRADAQRLAALLPHPAPEANKCTRGKLVLVGGAVRYPGAALLAGMAAQRMGAGYVEAFCAPSAVPILQAQRPSLVVRSWDELAVCELRPAEGHPRACLIGCGMDGADEQQAELVRAVLSACRLPVVADGGALGAIACAEGQRICAARAEDGLPTIVTPHQGEATRLASAAALQAPRSFADAESQAAFARALAQAYHATVLLKGPVSIVVPAPGCEAAAPAFLMDEGTPALAKAGTGDVLAGMVGALAAQGLDTADACLLASALHARAGHAAAERVGDISACAEDVLEAIPEAIGNL